MWAGADSFSNNTAAVMLEYISLISGLSGFTDQNYAWCIFFYKCNLFSCDSFFFFFLTVLVTSDTRATVYIIKFMHEWTCGCAMMPLSQIHVISFRVYTDYFIWRVDEWWLPRRSLQFEQKCFGFFWGVGGLFVLSFWIAAGHISLSTPVTSLGQS